VDESPESSDQQSYPAPYPPREITPAGPAMPVSSAVGEPLVSRNDTGASRRAARPVMGGKPGVESGIDWRVIFRLGARYFRARRALAAVYVVGLLVTVSILPVATTAMFGILTRYFQGGGVSGVGNPPGALERTYAIWVALVLAGTVVVFGHRYIAAYFKARVQNDLSADVFGSLLRQSPSFFHEHDADALDAIVNQWTAQVSTGLIQLLIDPAVQVVGVIIVAVTLYEALLELSSRQGGGASIYELFAVIAVVALMAPVLVVRLGRQLQQQTAAAQQESLGMMTLVGGALRSPEEVQAMRAESYFADRYRKLLGSNVRTRMRQTVIMERLNVLSSLPGDVVLVLLIGVAVLMVIRNPASATPYTIVAVGLLTPQLMGAVQSLANVSINAQMTWPAMQMVTEALDAKSEVHVDPHARDIDTIEPTVEVRDVTFSYVPGVLPNILHNVTFSVPTGKVTGLVARPGRGKTTLFRLLLRFYDPQQGELRLGGIPITEFTLGSLRRHIALMTQESAFFHDSVRENFRVAGVDLTDAAITEMSERTGLLPILTHEFGERALDAPFVGERLSGGQRKLFALTRLLLQQPSVVLFDEPTVGMGPLEKVPLVDVMRAACNGRTVISVDHDMVWQTRFCDYFLVLDEGQIVQRGTSDELMQQPAGLFRQLYDASEYTHTTEASGPMTAPSPAIMNQMGVAVALPA
jgi:ATP-binding cassette, subfamily B, bacterial